MKLEFPEFGKLGEHELYNCEMKFAVLKITEETAKKVLILFPSRLGHKMTISNWIREHSDHNPEFLGAGVTNITKEVAVWGSRSCARPSIEGGFGKEKPENSNEADILLDQVKAKVIKLSKTLQEA